MWRYAITYPDGKHDIYLLVQDKNKYRFVSTEQRKVLVPIFDTVNDALNILDAFKETKYIAEWEVIE